MQYDALLSNQAWIQNRLEEAFPEGEIDLKNPRGDDQHFLLRIRHPKLKNLSLIQGHQVIYKSLDHLRNGCIHALSIEILA